MAFTKWLWTQTSLHHHNSVQSASGCDRPRRAALAPLTLPLGLFLMLLSMKDNYLFLKEVKNLVEKTNCELKVCFQYMNRGDRWIQVRGARAQGKGAARALAPRDLL